MIILFFFFFCGRPGENFFCHPHFRKQEYYFFCLVLSVLYLLLLLPSFRHKLILYSMSSSLREIRNQRKKSGAEFFFHFSYISFTFRIYHSLFGGSLLSPITEFFGGIVFKFSNPTWSPNQMLLFTLFSETTSTGATCMFSSFHLCLTSLLRSTYFLRLSFFLLVDR